MRAFWIGVTAGAVMLAGCGDGGTGPTEPAGTFTTDQATYEPFELARVALSGAAPAAGATVTATLADEEVVLLPEADSALVFMVPGGVAGTHELTFSTGGVRYSGSVTVAAVAPVADPEAYIAAATSEAEAAIASIEAGLGAEPVSESDAADVQAMLAAARDSLASFEAALAQMTPAEVEQIAGLLRQHLGSAGEPTAATSAALAAGVVHATAGGAIPTQCRNLTTALDSYTCTWGVFGTHIKDVATYLAAAWLLAESTPLTGMFGMGAAAVMSGFALVEGAMALHVGIELVRIHGLIAWEIGRELYDATSGYFRTDVVAGDGSLMSGFALASVSDAMTTSDMSTFTQGVPVSFTFQPMVRRVQPGDAELPLAWLSTGLEWLAKYNEVISRFGTRFVIDLAEPSTAWLAPVPSSQVSVEVVSGNVQLDHAGGTGNVIEVEFTSQSSQEEPFAYDVVYSSGVYPDVRVRHEATLRPPSFVVAHADGTPVNGTVWFYPWVAQTFVLQNQDGSPVQGADYSRIYINNATNPAVQVVDGDVEGGFMIRLDSQERTDQTATFDVWYDGRHVQTMSVGYTLGNPPTMTGVVKGCTENGYGHRLEVSYRVEGGPPFSVIGSYYGVPYSGTYPIRLEFLSSGQWQHASNGYDVNLISGDGYAGVAEVIIRSTGGGSCTATGQYTQATTWFDGWRVYLMDAFDRASAMHSFQAVEYRQTY